MDLSAGGITEMWDWVQDNFAWVQNLVDEYKKRMKKEKWRKRIAAIKKKKRELAAKNVQIGAMDLPTDLHSLLQLGLSGKKLA
jgi:hypothetical protein